MDINNTLKKDTISKDFISFINQANLPPLTNNQLGFAEWLLLPDNQKMISKIGDLDSIFIVVRKYVKLTPKEKVKNK